MSVEAMKLALDALEVVPIPPAKGRRALEAAMDALRHAIEQAEEQEPVAWMFQHEETGRMHYVSNDGIHSPESFLSMNPSCKFVCALYTRLPQREWVGLTEPEIEAIVNAHTTDDHGYNIRCNGHGVASAVEAKLREKNT